MLDWYTSLLTPNQFNVTWVLFFMVFTVVGLVLALRDEQDDGGLWLVVGMMFGSFGYVAGYWVFFALFWFLDWVGWMYTS